MEDLEVFMYYNKKKSKKNKHYAGLISVHTDRKVRFLQILTKKCILCIDLTQGTVKKVKR